MNGSIIIIDYLLQELLIHKQKKEELTESIQVLKVDIKQLRAAIKEHSAMSTIRPRLPSRDKYGTLILYPAK